MREDLAEPGPLELIAQGRFEEAEEVLRGSPFWDEALGEPLLGGNVVSLANWRARERQGVEHE
jgi:hypothetical protein